MTPKSPFDIRQESTTSSRAWELSRYAFSSTPSTDEDLNPPKGLEEFKAFFSYVDDVAVAKVGVIPMTMNVRGSVLSMGGVTGVATMPSARRGGHIRALLQRSLEDMYAEGQVVSALYPFKTSFYELFGYAGWQAPMWCRIDPATLAPYLKIAKTGSVQLRESKHAIKDFYGLQREMVSEVHGMSLLPYSRFDGENRHRKSWMATLHEGDNVTAGLSYKMNLDKGRLEVQSAFWRTLNGKLNMLDFLARHVDQVKEIRLPLLPNENPFLWVTNDEAVTMLTNEEHSWGAPMARVVSVAGLTGIGAGNGTATVTVTDQHAPWNNGTWTFTGKDGVLKVEAGGDPQGDVTINGLSSMVYSGLDPRTLPVRGWGEVSAATVEALQGIFPPIHPHLHDMF